MRLLKWMSLIGIILFLTACEQPTDQEVYYEAQKKLGELTSYQCIAKIMVKSEEVEHEYVFKQSFKYPNQYRLEVMEPEKTRGTLTISNGKTAWLLHPAINQIWKLDSFTQSQERMMFIGYFLQNLLSTENANIYGEKTPEGEYVVVKTVLPGGNHYFYEQKLWLDKKRIEPTQLQILDEKGNVRFRVFYEDFQYNIDLDDSLFYLSSRDE